jgi:hypothetical protein
MLAFNRVSLRDPTGYGQQPLLFIPNQGQADDKFAYVAQKFGLYVGVSSQAVSMVFCKPNTNGIALHLVWTFVGASAEAELQGLDQAEGLFHYLLSDDPSSRFTNLPPFRKVVCKSLWHGIDVIIQDQDQALKYDWVVHPGGKPEKIRLTCEGCEDIGLDEEGNLHYHTKLGIVTDSKPVAYQADGSRLVDIACRYSLSERSDGSMTVGFELPEGYDDSLALVIDPILSYGVFLGGKDKQA